MNIPESRSVFVSTGSRLHFGLTRFRPDRDGCLNGAGVMIEQPETRLRIRPGDGFSTRGSQRIEQFARAWAHEIGVELPDSEIELISSPPTHCGFGSGTQLAQAVANGLNVVLGVDSGSLPQNARRVATLLDRGNRSMIGSYGFAAGGLIVDGSDPSGNSILARQIPIPDDWRLILVLPRNADKKFGLQEQAAFDNIVAEQRNRSRRLENLITETMIPAVESSDFEQFCSSVFEYGKLSGEYYTDVQGGIYNGPVVTAVVDSLRRLNARGVGQSSWGPVVFSWCENQVSADELLSRIDSFFEETVEAWISPVRNRAATVLSTMCVPGEIQST